jgi:hypothetical protein
MSGAGRVAQQPWMTRGLALGRVVVSALSLLAYVVLNAFAPELRGDQTGSANVLSKSGVGFAGLKILLDASGETTLIDRGEKTAERSGYSLTILTPEIFGTTAKDLADAARAKGPHLIVLPKWFVTTDPVHPGWALKLDALDAKAIGTLFDELSKGTKIARRKGVAKVSLAWSDLPEQPPASSAPIRVDTLQTVSGKNWQPVLADEKGQAVIAQLRGTAIYVLADPDLLNTQGVHDPRVARLATLIVDYLRDEDGPIAFDVTLNGFRATPDLMHEAFSPPFLGATLCALLAAALLGFHAVSRFGTPAARGRSIAFGKRALADSTAGLIRMLGREPHMAIRYALTVRNLALRRLGAPRETEAADAWLVRAQRRAPGPTYGELFTEARAVESVPALMRAARELYRWKRGIMNERV